MNETMQFANGVPQPYAQPYAVSNMAQEQAQPYMVQEVKPYTLRKLKTKDVFLMTKIIKEIGVEEIKNTFKSMDFSDVIADENEVDFSSIGMGVMLDLGTLLICNLHKCEKIMYEFLGNLSNKTIVEIAEQDPAMTMDMIIDIVKKEEFRDFFGRASRLLK